MEISKCAEDWEQVLLGDRDEVFTRHIIFESEYLSNNGELVGIGKLIYRINDYYYKEIEAWKVMLGISMCGTEILQSTDKANKSSGKQGGVRSPDVERLISSFRPSATTLKGFNLKDGENDLTYEYYVSDTVVDKVEVKIFVFNPKEKIIISDIDGTITK